MSPFLLKHPEQDFDLGVFVSISGSEFIIALQRSCSDLSGFSKSHFYSVKASLKLLFEILENGEFNLINEIRSNSKAFGCRDSWLQVIAAYHSNVSNKNIENSSKNKYISGINYVLSRLQNRGNIPRFNVLSTFKPKKKVSKSLLDFSLDELGGNSTYLDGEIDSVENILKSIEQELGDVDCENIADQCALILKNASSVKSVG